MEQAERKEKVSQKAGLLALSKPELIKVVTEVAIGAGVDPKTLQSSKGGQEFIKLQDTEMKVLNGEHMENIKKVKELRTKRINQYRSTTTSRHKPKTIIGIFIHPNTKHVAIIVYRGNDQRDFEVYNPFWYGDFGITEWDELDITIPKKKNKVVSELMTSLQKKYEILKTYSLFLPLAFFKPNPHQLESMPEHHPIILLVLDFLELFLLQHQLANNLLKSIENRVKRLYALSTKVFIHLLWSSDAHLEEPSKARFSPSHHSSFGYSYQQSQDLNGHSVDPGIANQYRIGNIVTARAEGNDGSAEVYHSENCYDNDIFNMFTQEEQYTKLLKPISEPHQVQQNDINVISAVSSMEQSGGTVEQNAANVEETRAYIESLYNSLAIKVEKVITVNRKMKEINADLTTELARYKNQEKCFKINQEKYTKLERCYQKSVYQKQCLTKKINVLHLSSAKTITTLNEEIANLNNHLSKEKSTVSFLNEEKKKLKSDFKICEDEILDKQIQLENKIKELDIILVKTGQSIQMMHMLSPKTDSFYHTKQKMALGYQNPFYLKQAQQKQQSLYNGKVLLE
uniref:Ribonuclease H-like domain-containing protein n=1 Tax=Tanacetum cinerariifolium TaxID=118510 RepID=A0A6L2JY53_TANCI|nr:ribonuclease H-like domain-containing protein [Tanacetum cinerariifolium]